jgi:hypothetical protein
MYWRAYVQAIWPAAWGAKLEEKYHIKIFLKKEENRFDSLMTMNL